MPNLIFTTVGTSIIDNFLSTRAGEPYREMYDGIVRESRLGDHDAFVTQAETNGNYIELSTIIGGAVSNGYTRSVNLPPSDPGNLLSAEVHSLLKMRDSRSADEPGFDPGNDTVVLCYSETLEGLLAASINHRILAKHMQCAHIVRHCLRNITAHDATRFTKAMTDNTIHAGFDQLRDNYKNPHTSICYTGGYKGLIPVLTLYAKDNKCDMYYLYENSSSLVVLRQRQGAMGQDQTSWRSV